MWLRRINSSGICVTNYSLGECLSFNKAACWASRKNCSSLTSCPDHVYGVRANLARRSRPMATILLLPTALVMTTLIVTLWITLRGDNPSIH
jgi:hypothetical protein